MVIGLKAANTNKAQGTNHRRVRVPLSTELPEPLDSNSKLQTRGAGAGAGAGAAAVAAAVDDVIDVVRGRSEVVVVVAVVVVVLVVCHYGFLCRCC